MYQFKSRALRILNKNNKMEPHRFIAEYFAENLKDLAQSPMELSAFISDIYMWLEQDINTNEAENKAASASMYSLVHSNWDIIKSTVQPNDLAELLVEAARCVNLAEHNSAKLADFVAKIREAGLSIEGDPENCIQMASIETFMVQNGKIIMKSVE